MPFFHPASFLATWFGLGRLPGAPGTWGSLGALPLAWWIGSTYGTVWLLVCAAMIFALGCRVSGQYTRRTHHADPGAVVIDEVAGQLLTLCAAPISLWSLIAGFMLFRLFDIVKPWPVSLADRKIKGGFGIMLDDVLAAIYAGALLFLLDRWVIQGG